MINSFNKIKSCYITTYFPIVIIIFVSILTFLPSFYDIKYSSSSSILMSSANSINQLNVMSVAVGVSIPMFLEILMDYKDISLSMLIPRMLCASGLLIPNLIYLFSNHNNPTLYLNVIQSRSTLIAGGLLVSLFHSGNSFIHKIFVIITTLTCAVYILVSSWDPDGRNIQLKVVIYGLYALSATEALFISIWYVRNVRKNWIEVMKSTSRQSTLIHACLISIYAITFQVIGAIFHDSTWGNTGTKELIAYNSLDIFVTVLAITIPSRLSRQESLRIKVRSLFLSFLSFFTFKSYFYSMHLNLRNALSVIFRMKFVLH